MHSKSRKRVYYTNIPSAYLDYVSLHGILFMHPAVSTIKRQCSFEHAFFHRRTDIQWSQVQSGALPRVDWSEHVHPTFSRGCFWDLVTVSVVISFSLYPQTLLPTWKGTPLPTSHPYCPPTLFDLATPLGPI